MRKAGSRIGCFHSETEFNNVSSHIFGLSSSERFLGSRQSKTVFMNQLLQNRFNELGTEEVLQLKHQLRDSPKILRLFSLLESKRDKKINTIDAVSFLYPEEDASFEVLRNRFFKLRKQLLSMMEAGGTGKSSADSLHLLPHEEKLYRCRTLISENHFQLARKELRDLVADCRKLNIFELLPEAIAQLIYCSLAMNQLGDSERLINEMNEASVLLGDFRMMQGLSRKAYLETVARNVPALAKTIQQLRRMSIRHKMYPRFRLFYHFTVFSYWAGLPGITTKSSARHLTALKKLLSENPEMPAGYYEPNATAIMQYYLLIGEGTNLYMKGNVQECYKLFKEAWEIQERTANLRIRRSDSHFLNRIAIEIATGRFREALKSAEELIEFQKEQRQEEKRLKGYAEIANIYTYSWPSLRCPNPEFIMRMLKEYVSLLRKNDSKELNNAISTQAIFHFLCGDWKTANKLILKPGVREVFSVIRLDIYFDLLQMNAGTPKEKIAQLQKQIESQLHKASSSDLIYALRRASALLQSLEEQTRKMKAVN